MDIKWKALGLVVLGWMLVPAVAAADGGRMSPSTLEAMGLGSLETISDADALAVRGKGFSSRRYYAKTSGRSRVSIRLPFDLASASDRDSYRARGRYKAAGGSESEAEIEVDLSIDDFEIEIEIEASAGGSSWAKSF
jgi:hypothetical protein